MLIAHYEHRLPADYDLGIIRSRAAQRGRLWDDVPELYFKAFLLRESGRHGATGHSYSSLYLWRKEEAFASFISGRFRSVIDSFGRPAIDTRFALDARRGQGRVARFAYRQDIDIPREADLAEVLAAEAARNQEAASRPAVVAAAVGVDVRQWRITRVQLSEGALEAPPDSVAYQVLYLARPLLDELPG
ncbi:DUF4865 family protein [Herbaspirillum sp. WKF16]|jgi:hypothetical protein|uniref:DUF4865 family protein n=1 Tax=Herbaspirillum sp. WKF16 TaxID=3028312 RepID=UPI0023A9BC88|nr:DUF4865 family protein [Herbaspirillum sp. WKF16]WDZ94148.1 DUF4865 family protein [Herbaspirillum sp. WKF16]